MDENALLPASCALGPVQADLSTTGGIPCDQNTCVALLTGGFTQRIAITGGGFFTSTLDTLFSLPIQVGKSAEEMSVRLNPVLTGLVVP